jgi:hypothetical protein
MIDKLPAAIARCRDAADVNKIAKNAMALRTTKAIHRKFSPVSPLTGVLRTITAVGSGACPIPCEPRKDRGAPRTGGLADATGASVDVTPRGLLRSRGSSAGSGA